MGFGDLLRAGRVLGSGLRLLGGYRAAAVIGFVLALGWFVLGLGADAHAAGGAYGGYGDPVPLERPIITRDVARAFFVWLTVGAFIWAGVLGGFVAVCYRWLLFGGGTVRRGAAGRSDGGGVRGLRPADRADVGATRDVVGA